MYGYFNRYLLVDLTRRALTDYEVPKEWVEKHLGGRGICARILFELGICDFLRERKSPLDEGNVIVFGTGPLQGSGIAGAGRHVVMAVSPRTKSVSDSYAGGYWGHELGCSGYDGIIVTGKSEKPTYLVVSERETQLHDASSIWGLNVGDTEDILKKKHGGKVLSIGIAGENLVPFACIINDLSRAAGRSGLGAVMGAKKLKAIVVNGQSAKKWQQDALLRGALKEFAHALMEDPMIGGFGKYGTTGGVLALNELGILPTRNFARGKFEGAEKISGEAMFDTILKGQETCTGCPVRCKRRVSTEIFGQTVDKRFGGPEYETLAAFGALCMNDNLPAIALANQLCNQYGLDTISVGSVLAFAMEAEERKEMVSGIKWGDAKVMITLIPQIAKLEGVGAVLSKGVDALSKEIGADYGVSVKGLEVAMHEPRGKKGLGISYATSPRGGTHLEAMHDTMLETESPLPELGLTEFVNRLTWENKAKLCKVFEDLYSFTNSLIMCGHVSWDFSTGSYNPYPKIRVLLKLATGIELDAEDAILIGERNYALLKILSANAGYTRRDDALPARFSQPLLEGGSAGERIDPEVLQSTIDEYYALRGFQGNIPTRETLKRLGIYELSKYLYAENVS